MHLIKGRLDYAAARNLPPIEAYLFFTGNSYIKRNGALVMGRGAALQVRDSFPGIDVDIGRQIDHLGFYGLCMSKTVQPNIGAFQVKYDFSNRAMYSLIEKSAEMLDTLARETGLPIYINFPGIGNGGLTRDNVWPIICGWPDNVFVYEL